jgi:hypothetical protein
MVTFFTTSQNSKKDEGMSEMKICPVCWRLVAIVQDVAEEDGIIYQLLGCGHIGWTYRELREGAPKPEGLQA